VLSLYLHYRFILHKGCFKINIVKKRGLIFLKVLRAELFYLYTFSTCTDSNYFHANYLLGFGSFRGGQALDYLNSGYANVCAKDDVAEEVNRKEDPLNDFFSQFNKMR
jgi:hypothetical protein